MNPAKTATKAPRAFDPLAVNITPALTSEEVSLGGCVGVITAITVVLGVVFPEFEPDPEPVPPETVLGTPVRATEIAAF